MGLPNINISFITKAETIITRSSRGVVAMIIKDDTEGIEPFKIYRSLAEVDFTKVSETNYKYLKLAFEGAPSKIMVWSMPSESGDLSTVLTMMRDYKWNYLAMPSADKETATSIISWIKEQRAEHSKSFKAVLANVTADHESIINLTTTDIESTITDSKLSAEEYCARIAGIIAGLSLDRSLTYYALDDVVSASTPADADTRVDNGELVIVFDGEKFKIGRGVNSLKTVTADKTGDMKKIKIIESRDMINDDIRSTFSDDYVGKFINDYDNKQRLVSAIANYYKGLEGNVLNANTPNTVSISLEKQKAYLEANDVDTSKMSDQDILMANTGSHIFLDSSINLVDAMEDMKLDITM